MAGAFAHLELRTTDAAASRAFYAALLGWSARDVPMGPVPYTLFELPGGPTAGMMTMPAEPAWLPFVEVVDVAASLTRAVELGGRIEVPATALPGAGAFGVILDPGGARLGLIQH